MYTHNFPKLSQIKHCMFCGGKLCSKNTEGVCGCITCRRIKVALNVNSVTFVETYSVEELKGSSGRRCKIVGLARGQKSTIKKSILLDLAAFAVFQEPVLKELTA